MQVCHGSPAGVGMGTIERGKNMGKAKTKEVLLEIVSNVYMSSNLHQRYKQQTFLGWGGPTRPPEKA